MFGLNTYMLIGIAVVLGMMGIYFAYSQHEMKAMAATIATQKEAILAQQVVITQMENDEEDIQGDVQSLSDLMNAQNVQSDKLDQALMKLADLSPQNAKLIEDLINRATVERLRCMALATGAMPVKGETNHVCPQLLPAIKKGK